MNKWECKYANINNSEWRDFSKRRKRKAHLVIRRRTFKTGCTNFHYRLYYAIFPNAWGYRLPSKQQCQDYCLQEARHSDDNMTVTIVCQSWDGYFIIHWQKQWQPVARQGWQHSLSVRIGRADMTFSWTLPCWSFLWAGREDNDTAQSPSYDVLLTFNIYVTIFVTLIYHKHTFMNFPVLFRPQYTLKLRIDSEMSESAIFSLCAWALLYVSVAI